VEAFGIVHVLQKRLHLNLSLFEGSILRQIDLFAFPDLVINIVQYWPYERILSELRPDYQYLCQFSSTNGIHNFFHWMRFSHAIFNQSRCDTPLFESNGPSIFLQAIVLDDTQEALPSPATSLYNNRIVSERLW